MSSDKNDRDIEIIPPGQSPKDGREDWTYVTFEGSAKAFRDLPLHKRIMLGAAWLAGILLFCTIVFLIVASAVLIWIPLLLATAIITGLIVFIRAKLRRR